MRHQVREWLFDVAVKLVEKCAGRPLKGETRIWVLVSAAIAWALVVLGLRYLIVGRAERAERRANEIAEKLPPEDWHAPSAEEVARVVGPRPIAPAVDRDRAIDRIRE